MTDMPHAPDHSRLAHFPVTFFATVMGLAGLTLALHLAETRFGWGHLASQIALMVAIADFAAIAVLFVLKGLRHPGAIQAEWAHPVKLAFFPAISISLLLIATALRAEAPGAAGVVWSVGAAAQGVLTLAVISGWIGRRPFQPMHISPAWFIPAVGNVIVPVAGVPLGFVEVSWLFFSVGLMFWVVLLTLVMNRLIFHDPLPGRLLPTLVILIAPPAVAFLGWLQLNGGVLDAFARVLYYAAIGFAAIVAIQAQGFAKLPFALSWWALSFPVAALTIATLRFGELAGSGAHDLLGGAFLALLGMIVAGLIWRTLKAAAKGEICQPE
ncbi:SLAC1 anion channel family protein [Tropicibacter naphthalenivorans]|uniref:Tellurite resistance protein TehA n=1 Tax=Tropicibacter naphthalenivorans TaxID=441103 RepID=A0A0N7M0N1_9RHOB|nr:SLAC1 anion channel family protein [Tropicibacter naphthalenivorans]CUH80929.1 Tellurite resistance protein TehA [Tropicibacter naphthalenivorans]SMC91229.1 tellurite resistance protein [Tropicibacter naphthalenivorans]